MKPHDVALLVAALEGHGLTLYVHGSSVDVQSDDREVETEPIGLLDAMTKNKSAVVAFLQSRGEQPAPVRVLDRREELAPSSFTPSSNPGVPVPCRLFSDPHPHDAMDFRCLTLEGHQRVGGIAPEPGGPHDDGSRWFAGPGETAEEPAPRLGPNTSMRIDGRGQALANALTGRASPEADPRMELAFRLAGRRC